MSVRALKTLLAIHDEGSFQAAARRLNMTLSAASMQMKQLKETYAPAFDLRPLKWSSLKYGFRMEDKIDGKEEAYG